MCRHCIHPTEILYSSGPNRPNRQALCIIVYQRASGQQDGSGLNINPSGRQFYRECPVELSVTVSLAGYGNAPSLEHLCPRYTISLLRNWHFFVFSLRPPSAQRGKYVIYIFFVVRYISPVYDYVVKIHKTVKVLQTCQDYYVHRHLEGGWCSC
ncbi:hypothetical protein EVAR_71445_1 [Eumeta japonica]|uniref:Uncharacterized protein n=1 Tax=Eumeta variegata TaxID=151549 RepID=A0A4C1SCU4_EUMVA|nr:hypothetical protein EVAR_71445_1 [Eumeta japonica]